MLTMHPVLQVGAYDFAPNPLGLEEFQERLDRLRAVMADNQWSHVLVFGSIPDFAMLTYLTNFTPRLAPAMALIPLQGELRLLSFVGGRMVDAASQTTWVEKVQTVKDIGETLPQLLQVTSAPGRVALAEFDNLRSEIFSQISAIPQIEAAVDGTAALRELRRQKSPTEITLIQSACSILSNAVKSMREKFAAGRDGASCILAAESAALQSGAQDVRILYNPVGGVDLRPLQIFTNQPASAMTAYIAVKYRGYWAGGFSSVIEKDITSAALTAMIDKAKPGVTKADLKAARDAVLGNYSQHPLVENSLCQGMGVAIEEQPAMTNIGTAELMDGDVCSLQVGYHTEENGYVLGSAMILIEENGCRLLWR